MHEFVSACDEEANIVIRHSQIKINEKPLDELLKWRIVETW